MRVRMPLVSVRYQILSSLAAMQPSVSAGPRGMVATTLLVATSTRESVLSPQLGTQILPNAAASPAHGSLPTGTTAATLLVFGSSRVMESLGLFPIQTESGRMVT